MCRMRTVSFFSEPDRTGPLFCRAREYRTKRKNTHYAAAAVAAAPGLPFPGCAFFAEQHTRITNGAPESWMTLKKTPTSSVSLSRPWRKKAGNKNRRTHLARTLRAKTTSVKSRYRRQQPKKKRRRGAHTRIDRGRSLLLCAADGTQQVSLR